jgi:nucleotide-binding universal stress UspA family protein
MFSDILLAVDLTSPATQEKAVGIAVEHAKAFGSRLHVITIVPEFNSSIVAGFFPPDFEEKALEHAREQLHGYCERAIPEGVEVQHIVGHGTIHTEIVEAANSTGSGLIIMASHHPDLSDLLISANAERVVRHSDCSVLVVRS